MFTQTNREQACLTLDLAVRARKAVSSACCAAADIDRRQPADNNRCARFGLDLRAAGGDQARHHFRAPDTFGSEGPLRDRALCF
ncbi:hypothetical protein [Massilia cavernae]|uniref:hypothetical protein n=1 Tax=Massilia cavernae TaxID=2320864 RepID=UPI0011C39AD2|nr:hypothetical protein [Massilia cavernae]